MGGDIYAAINGVMSEIGAIAKDRKNVQQNFNYRGIDDVMNALQPLLIKNKIFIIPETLEHAREERTSKSGGSLVYSVMKIKYTFYAADGSSVSAVVIGEGMDGGDKASNKAMAIAMKYACFQVFCIPTEEMADPDGDSHEIKPAAKTTVPQAVPAPVPPKPKPAQQDAIVYPDSISEAQARRLYAISGGNAELCKEVMAGYGYTSSKDIQKADYDEICNEVKSLLGQR